MYADPALATVFSAMFHARTLLFVGYGLADEDFDQVRARAGRGGRSGATLKKNKAAPPAQPATPAPAGGSSTPATP